MPTMMDIFNNRPFRAVELTTMMELQDVVPTLLGDMGEALFPTQRVRSRMIAIYKHKGAWRLVPVSPIGAPPVETERFPGDMRPFSTRRLAKGSTVYAEELQGILAMPMFDAVVSMQTEIASRAAQIQLDMDLTHEHMRLGAVQGKVIDADGTTVLDDWFANWGVPAPRVWNFKLNVPTTGLRLICQQLRDAVWYASQGSWIEGRTTIHSLCGGDFFQKITTHPMVERTYLNYQAAAELRGEIPDEFIFGGIVWHRYRGTPNMDFAIPDDECRFFPMGTSDAFGRVMGPAEFDPFINEAGRDVYAMLIPDRDRGAWARTEAYNYPLFVCRRPEMLQQGTAG